MLKRSIIARLLAAGSTLLLVLSCLPGKESEPSAAEVPSAKAQIDKAQDAAGAANAAAARADELSGAIDGTAGEEDEDDGEDDGER